MPTIINKQLFSSLTKEIKDLDLNSISKDRINVLKPFIAYLQNKINENQDVNLNFICTHNSRRSHLSQIWAQTMASYYQVPSVYCYSGGTEATSLFPMIAETLKGNGFQITTISIGENPIYSIKYSDGSHPIIGFSKKYDTSFNPKSKYAAIMTCSHADSNCPVIPGADIRIPLTYEDPKLSDNTSNQEKVYLERSLQIATEMKFVFSKIKTNAQ